MDAIKEFIFIVGVMALAIVAWVGSMAVIGWLLYG